ncbi:hypothetical protein Tco_0712340 [Tanacetum coccineum]
MALQYSLLFPYGEDGFHDKIPYYINTGNQKTNRGFVTMKEYYSYIIQQRNDQEDNNICKTAAQIDDIISAEIPSVTNDPDGYKAVTNYMLHGPCGKDETYAPCTTEGPDRATIVIHENVRKGDHVTSEKVVAVDEINNYLNCRYLAPGPKDFDDLITVSNKLCHTFKEAYFAYGLLNDDREWTKAISEVSL